MKVSDKETALWIKEAAESIALAALRYRTFQMPTHIAEIIAAHCPIAAACTAPAPQPAEEIVKGLSLRGIQYCAELADEGSPWESVAEPEPQYFATFLEAYDFQMEVVAIPQVTAPQPADEHVCQTPDYTDGPCYACAKDMLMEWVFERYENCVRISDEKTGEDRAEWLKDADHFMLILSFLRGAATPQVTAVKRCFNLDDHSEHSWEFNSESYICPGMPVCGCGQGFTVTCPVHGSSAATVAPDYGTREEWIAAGRCPICHYTLKSCECDPQTKPEGK